MLFAVPTYFRTEFGDFRRSGSQLDLLCQGSQYSERPLGVSIRFFDASVLVSRNGSRVEVGEGGKIAFKQDIWQA
jgi:hypothetical protein